MPAPEVCEYGHRGKMREFHKDGSSWWSCTHAYPDGQKCWGKPPKDAPVVEEWNPAPAATWAPAAPQSWKKAKEVLHPDFAKIAWEILQALNQVADKTADVVAADVRQLALGIQDGVSWAAPVDYDEEVDRESKLEKVRALQAQINALATGGI